MSLTRYGFISSIVLPLLIITSANATTRLVPSQFATIQAGIDAAAVGDTVLVAPGTYTGVGNRDINFNGKDVVLLSESGPEVTIIDADAGTGNWHRVFMLFSGETAAARIDGFTITGGSLPGPASSSPGAGVFCLNGSPTITRCIFRDNWSGAGGLQDPSKGDSRSLGCGVGGAIAIRANPSPMTVSDCVFVENGSTCGVGGAVFVDQTQDVLFERCAIVQNRGTGLYVAPSAEVALRSCTIAHTADVEEAGYGVVLWTNATAQLDRCVIWGDCSGLWIESGATMQVACSVIDTSNVTGTGTIGYTGENVFSDPLFCSPRGCPRPAIGDLGDYRVDPLSPCLPENNPCGVLIGALPSCATDTDVPPGAYDPAAALSVSPNPFSTTTTFSLAATIAPNSMLTVFDIAGRRVREFRLGDGARSVTWDGDDQHGVRLSAGMYFVQTDVGTHQETARVTLVR